MMLKDLYRRLSILGSLMGREETIANVITENDFEQTILAYTEHEPGGENDQSFIGRYIIVTPLYFIFIELDGDKIVNTKINRDNIILKMTKIIEHEINTQGNSLYVVTKISLLLYNGDIVEFVRPDKGLNIIHLESFEQLICLLENDI